MPKELTVIVNVRAGARERSITVDSKGIYKIKTTAPPEKGKANKDVVDMLAEHFRVPKSAITLKIGHTSPRKIFKIIA